MTISGDGYHLYIHIRQEGGGGVSPVAPTPDTPAPTPKPTPQPKGEGSDQLTSKLKSLVSYHFIKGQADKALTYAISHISMRTGRSEYQQRVSSVYSTASSGLDFAVLEAGLVASGNVPLAVLNLATKGIGVSIDISKKQNDIRLERSVEREEMLRQQIRAGTGGRRNNGDY